MDRYIKQIQTRMNRRLKIRDQSVTKQQVRDIYLTVVNNPDKPTDIEMSRVTELLAKHLSSQEDVIEEKADGRWQEAEGGIREEGQEKEEMSATSSLPPSAIEPLPSHLEMTLEDTPDVWETPGSPAEQPQELALSRTESSPPAPPSGISQAEVEQAVELAIAQTGESGSAEAKEIMSQLALHLSSDINTLEQAVAALVCGYLNKRSNVLKNAMGTLNTLRNAQTHSFCSGLTPDFLAKQETAKKQLMEIANTFN